MKEKINLNVMIMAGAVVLIAILMFALDVAKASVVGITESVSASIGEIDDTALCVIATLLMMVPAIFAIVSVFVLDAKKQKDLIKLVSMIACGVAVVGIIILCVILFDSESSFGVTIKIAPTITVYISMLLSLCTVGLTVKDIVLNK